MLRLSFLFIFLISSLIQAEPQHPKTTDGFLEKNTPFLRSALVFKHNGKEHRIRRGVIIPLHQDNLWACFDPDQLRWAVIWRAPAASPPISYDSMASISFPNEKAKAFQPPQLLGEVLLSFPSTSEQAPLTSGPGPVPLDHGHWKGIHLSGTRPFFQYQLKHAEVFETIGVHQEADGTITGIVCDVKHADKIFRVIHRFAKDSKQRSINEALVDFPVIQPAIPFSPKSFTTDNLPSHIDGPFTVRPKAFPKQPRPIRATDLAFLSDGTALLVTLDGDVWRIQDVETQRSIWTRIATGLFEPMAIEISKDDQVFILGRDQITELIDTNDDGHIDIFRNASDAFLQTLHTRDYATSLALGDDGSFYIAKGGIYSRHSKGTELDHSKHRGTILRITPDGRKSEILADGLRLPYVGLRNDGTVFASDQQGHYVPSTPIHLIGNTSPFLGFIPTNHRKITNTAEPLIWYPYQTNRSGAAFTTTSPVAFPDTPDTFLHVSWNGRLFAIATPETGQPFSWQLPLQLDFPSLNGALHPKSGRLYLVGLGISGYIPSTPKLTGLASIEQTSSFPTPSSVNIQSKQITITFSRPLTAKETVSANTPALRLFDIKRTKQYGSGHFKWDGNPGEQHFQPTQQQLSADRQTLTLTFDTLYRSDISHLRVTISSDSVTAPINIFSHPTQLAEASATDLKDISKQDKTKTSLAEGDVEKGKALFTQYACIGCHSLTGQKLVGPPLNAIGKRDKAFLTQSILEPNSQVAAGYEPNMPSFAGVINEQDLEHLISYLKSLN